MKILLLSPCKDPRVKKPGFLMIPQLALHLIAGLTPEEHEVKIVEEESEEIDLEEDCSLVGISCMTSNATRAYHLAREFRRRGKTVVLGGIHPTLLPQEALRHADSVVIGEAEGVWERLLEDFQQGRLQPHYHDPCPPLDRYIPIGRRRPARRPLFDVVPVMTTRGCPYHCDFCCVHDIFGPRIRHIPVDNVVRDIVDSGGRFFIFLDDNIIGDRAYARSLFQAIAPLRIRWVGQASLSFVKDAELLRLAGRSGCAGLFFGLESVADTQLRKMRKSAGDAAGVQEAISRITDSGIYFHASLIFGFDDDTLDTFPRTLDFLERNRISSASINVLTPYPGTQVFRRFKEEGRLLTEDWIYYDHSTTVFRPKNMTPFELQAGRLWVASEFTRLSAVLRRLPANLDWPLFHLAVNLGLHRGCRNDLKELPRLAARLFPEGEDRPGGRRPAPLWSLRWSDLLPRRPSRSPA